MKILIYVIVFFIYSALEPFVGNFLYNMFAATYGYGTDTTALYCGLCAALFAGSAYLCAHRLCKLWDKKQSTKAQRNSHADAATKAIEPKPVITEPSPPSPIPLPPLPPPPSSASASTAAAPSIPPPANVPAAASSISARRSSRRSTSPSPPESWPVPLSSFLFLVLLPGSTQRSRRFRN